MNEIHVHIERLVIEGVDRTSIDTAALHAAVSAAVERELVTAAEAHAGGTPPSPRTHGTVRAPSFTATTNVATFGQRAGGALASALTPLCLGQAKTAATTWNDAKQG